MSKSITILFILAFLGLSGIALAEEQPVDSSGTNLQEVTAEDLGLKEPKILPDSPIYFLKDWTRNIRTFLTFDPVKKLELRTKIANEKLLETKKLVEKSKKPEIIKKALDKYQTALNSVKNLAEKMKEKTANAPETEKFLEKFEQQKELHQRILQKFETQVPEQVLGKIREAREMHLERFRKVMERIEAKRTAPSGNKEILCKDDSDCACGRNKTTKECSLGNKQYIDSSASAQCPDFCSGIGGNLRIKCVSNKCQQVAQ